MRHSVCIPGRRAFQLQDPNRSATYQVEVVARHFKGELESQTDPLLFAEAFTDADWHHHVPGSLCWLVKVEPGLKWAVEVRSCETKTDPFEEGLRFIVTVAEGLSEGFGLQSHRVWG